MFQLSRKITAGASAALWHYANGRCPCFADETEDVLCGRYVHHGAADEVIWGCYSHRGVQMLDDIEFPKSQKRYIFSPRFDVRVNTAFEHVVRCCADPSRRVRFTEPLIAAYIELHRRGFAHSFEAWQGGQLAGGCFGVQLGCSVTMESMFHHVSNAAEAAYGQGLLRLRERGFRMVDTIGVVKHSVNYGARWMRHWRYEGFLRDALRQWPSVSDDRPAPALPATIRWGLGASRIYHATRRRVHTPAAAAQPERKALRPV